MQPLNSSQAHSVKILTHEQISTLVNIIQSAGSQELGVQLATTLLNYTLGNSSQSVNATVTANITDKEDNNSKDCFADVLKFTDKEINKMPKQFKRLFRHQGCTARVYRRRSGKGTYNYEIRFRRDDYNVYASANNLEEAKAKFIEKLKIADKQSDKKSTVPTTFTAFALYYMDTFWKRTVTELTYKNEMYRFNNHLKPYFGETPLIKISPFDCQTLIDRLAEQKMNKTATEVYSSMSKIFKAAIDHGIITRNPITLVVKVKHKRKHGKALTKEEERQLLEYFAGTKYQLLFAIVLYTGLRPNEYKTAVIDGKFIKAVNSKQKDGEVHYKRIPITPMLKPYLENVTDFKFASTSCMGDKLHEVLPNHMLYDMRTTFYTRCQECGVAEVATKTFVGHSLGGLADTYTDLSDEFLLKEAQKFSY